MFERERSMIPGEFVVIVIVIGIGIEFVGVVEAGRHC